MKKLLILLVLAALAQGLFADDLDGYETVLSVGFEEAEGYVLGALNGQCGWTSFNENFNFRLVDDTEAFNGNNSVYVFTDDAKNSGSKTTFEYENPDSLPVTISFMMRPSEGPVRFHVTDFKNQRIKKFAISSKQLTLDNPYDAIVFRSELDTTAWYRVSLSFDPNDSFIEPIQIFEAYATNALLETRAMYDNQSSAFGEPGGFAIATEWTDTNTHSYIDDLTVTTMTIPEPVFIGLVALVGLLLLRRRG
ncbi:hypothetical protein IJS98_03100 [bacterium]|nr:hypothetical protein [bacterium]